MAILLVKLDPFLEMTQYHTMYQDGFISEEGEQLDMILLLQ